MTSPNNNMHSKIQLRWRFGLLVAASFLFLQINASETRSTFSGSRSFLLNDGDDSCQHDSTSESKVCEETNSPYYTDLNCTSHQNSAAGGECVIPVAGASASEAESTSASSVLDSTDAKELMQRGTFAMEKGMHFLNHVKQLVQLVRSSRGNGPQTEVPESLSSKWLSIHERAVQALRESFELFLEASKMATPLAVASESKLLEVRECLVELHTDALSPPSRLRAVSAAI